LSLVVKASDRFNLAGEPHIGSGDHYELEVVTPDELLALLEAREINLRRRFEQIIEETTGTRDMLLRVQTDRPGQTSGQDPEDAKPKGDGAQADSVQAAVGRQESLRLLRAQQAVVQSQKSAQEVLGVAASFRDIREELIANRVDTEDRKQRLQEKIAEPLEKIGTKMFPELDRRVERLVAVLNKAAPATPVKEPAEAEPAAAAQRAVEQANAILVAMQNVLQDMLDVETYNELLDLVRGLIEDQERLIGDTKKLQKKQVLELLK
jgi:hypothetical protein